MIRQQNISLTTSSMLIMFQASLLPVEGKDTCLSLRPARRLPCDGPRDGVRVEKAC